MITERIFEWAVRNPEKTAIIWNGLAFSYLDFSNAIQSARESLARENLPIGRTAIVLTDSILDCWINVMALRSLGLDTIPVHSVEEAATLNIKDVAALVTTGSATWLNPILSKPEAKIIAVAPIVSNRGTTSQLIESRLNAPFGGHILYTSGTTGTLKKVVLAGAHEKRRNEVRSDTLGFSQRTTLHCLDFELWTGLGFKYPSAVWFSGGNVVVDQRRNKFDRFFEHPANFVKLLPWQLKALLSQPKNRDQGMVISVAGGALALDAAEQCVEKITSRLMIQYNATEISNERLLTQAFKERDDLQWLTPMDENVVQVVDPNGDECAVNIQGELRILLSDIDCRSYLDDPDSTAMAFRNGYFYPGDVAIKRVDGRVGMLGRASDVLIVKGEKLASAPIEHRIQRELQVDEVCVFSGLSKSGQEELIIVIQTDRQITRASLEAVAGRFPRFERVRFSIRKEFPRTETKKTKRTLLKSIVFSEIDTWPVEVGSTQP